MSVEARFAATSVRARFAAALSRLGPFGARPRLAVACSGGADSTALSLLAHEFCKGQGGEVRAFIVDHGLRTGSADEAALTARRLAGRGIEASILTLHGLPRGAGLQEAARAARYEALGQAASCAGFLHLLLGHHAQDQAETVAMRAARGPGGAEGMAAWSARADILLLRPLLSFNKLDLQDYLRAERMEWVEDPSNESPRFERVRVRQEGAGLAPGDASARVARELEAAAFLARFAQIRPEGFAVLDAASAPAAALGALIRGLGGGFYPPRRERLARLAASLRPATLGGVRVTPAGRLGPGWLLAREPAACAAPVPAHEGAVWDGRFRLGRAESGASLGALAGDSNKYRGFNELPSIVLRSMPALRESDGTIRFPCDARFAPPAPITSHPFAP